MAMGLTPHYQNDMGAPVIAIGAKEFMCIGATPPFDHPHVFLDMGDSDDIVCPYCSTRYRHDPRLPWGASAPPEARWTASKAA